MNTDLKKAADDKSDYQPIPVTIRTRAATIFGALLISVSLFCICEYLPRRVATEAVIISTSPHPNGGRDEGPDTIIYFEYSVGGRKYPAEADTNRKFQKGQSVEVWYFPRKPSEPTLREVTGLRSFLKVTAFVVFLSGFTISFRGRRGRWIKGEEKEI